MFENDERRDEPAHDSPSTEGGVRRRDVMKAAGGAILADASLTSVGAAQTTFCGTDDCRTVVKPPKDAYVFTNGRECVTFDKAYLDAKMEEGFDTLGVKSGSCTDQSDGNKDCDYVALEGGTYSYCAPDTCNDVGHPELLQCDDCTYEDSTYAVETAYANCKSIPVCVSGVDSGCPVTAELDVSGADCSETTLTREFSAIGRHTFELSGCCTPQKLTFTDGQEALATVDVPFTNCGYADLSVGNVQFCCGTVSFDLSGVECNLVAALTLARDDCRKQIKEGISDDGPVKFDWSGCFTPQSLTLEREDGETVAELSPTDALTCRCPDDARTACEFDGGELPSRGETKQFECDGVTFDVTTTKLTDGRPACFEITGPSDPIFRVDVEGDGTTTYSFTDCGTERTGELCANAASADDPTGVENWAVAVCTEDVGGCVSGSVSTVGDQEVEWQMGDVASSCADVGGDTGGGGKGNGGDGGNGDGDGKGNGDGGGEGGGGDGNGGGGDDEGGGKGNGGDGGNDGNGGDGGNDGNGDDDGGGKGNDGGGEGNGGDNGSGDGDGDDGSGG